MKKSVTAAKLLLAASKALKRMKFQGVLIEKDCIKFQVHHKRKSYPAFFSVYRGSRVIADLAVIIHAETFSRRALAKHLFSINKLNYKFREPGLCWNEKKQWTVSVLLLIPEKIPTQEYLAEWITLGTLGAMQRLDKLKTFMKKKQTA